MGTPKICDFWGERRHASLLLRVRNLCDSVAEREPTPHWFPAHPPFTMITHVRHWIIAVGYACPSMDHFSLATRPPTLYALTTAFHAATLIIGHLVDGCAYIVRISGDGIAARFLVVVPNSIRVFSHNKRSARKRFFLIFPPHLEESELLRCIVLFDGLALDDNGRVTALYAR